MINITICSGEEGEFVSCKATGHSDFAMHGGDIVCSAVTILLRTVALALEEKAKTDKDLNVELRFQERGNLEVNVLKYGKTSFDYLTFIFSFLKLGLVSLECEYPASVSLECLVYSNKKRNL